MGKDILITPGDALINFSGASAGNINQIVQDDGRVSFIGISSGAEQLTISDSLTGSVFTVNNSISSPIIDIDFDNTITVPHGASDGYVWTSDSGGTATWQAVAGSSSGSCTDTLWVSTISGCSPVDIGPEVNIDGKLSVVGSGSSFVAINGSLGQELKINDRGSNNSYTHPNVWVGNESSSGAVLNIGSTGSISSYHTGSWPGLQLRSSTGKFWFFNDTYGGASSELDLGSGDIKYCNSISSHPNYALKLYGGPGPNDQNDGLQVYTADSADTYTLKLEIKSDITNPDAYFTNIGGLGINTTSPTHTLDVNGDGRFTTNLTVGGGLNVTGDTKIDGNVTINTSGNTATPVFKILGSTGELFTITDSLLGELFAVNDISGLPILRVLSDDTVLMGNIQAPSLNTTSKKIVNAGSTILYDIPSSGYTSAYFDYNIVGNAGARAGNVMSIWSGTSINYAETATSDIGDTSPVTLSVAFSGSNTSFIASATTNNWVVKTIVRSI